MHTPDPTPDPEELPAMVPNTILAMMRTQPFANETTTDLLPLHIWLVRSHRRNSMSILVTRQFQITSEQDEFLNGMLPNRSAYVRRLIEEQRLATKACPEPTTTKQSFVLEGTEFCPNESATRPVLLCARSIPLKPLPEGQHDHQRLCNTEQFAPAS